MRIYWNIVRDFDEFQEVLHLISICCLCRTSKGTIQTVYTPSLQIFEDACGRASHAKESCSLTQRKIYLTIMGVNILKLKLAKNSIITEAITHIGIDSTYV